MDLINCKDMNHFPLPDCFVLFNEQYYYHSLWQSLIPFEAVGNFPSYYRLQRSCGKVMFLHLYIIHFVLRGVSASVHAGLLTPQAGTLPRQVHSLGRNNPGIYIPPPGRYIPPGQVHPPLAGSRPVRYTPCQVHPQAGTPLGRYTPWQEHPTFLARYTPSQVHPQAGTPPRQLHPYHIHPLSGTPLVRYISQAGTPPRQVHCLAGTPHLPGQVHPQAGTSPGRYTPRQLHPWQVHPPWAGTRPLAGTPPWRSLQRTTRILLECFLVMYSFFKSFCLIPFHWEQTTAIAVRKQASSFFYIM